MGYGVHSLGFLPPAVIVTSGAAVAVARSDSRAKAVSGSVTRGGLEMTPPAETVQAIDASTKIANTYFLIISFLLTLAGRQLLILHGSIC